MIINFNSITKYFGSDLILDKISGVIKSNSRIGIIGANGAGKTTLMNILSGVLDYDDGELYINPDVKFGYLLQNSLLQSENTVYEEMNSVFAKEHEAIAKLTTLDTNNPAQKSEYERLYSFITARDAYNTDVKIKSVLNGMGFDQDTYSKKVNVLSGGEKTRLALAKLLIKDCNVLLLDEPTNHLDFKTCAWLENYLKDYKGAVISVTHDRYYLNSVSDTIWEVEFGKLTEYKGNYNDYKAQKKQKLDYQQKLYDEYIERQQKLKDYVAKNLVRASTSAMAKSRQKDLDKMEKVERPSEYNKSINLKFTFDKKSWFDVLRIKDLTLNIGQRTLFSGLNLDVKAGQKIAFIGQNGVGKTTLFKALCGEHNQYSGSFKWGKDTSIGVFTQNKIYSNSQNTVLDELWDNFKTLNEVEIRSKLGSLLFSGDDVFKKVSDISGGESARLQLAILSMQKNNTLMFDEPTNHLDMPSKEALENALVEFLGTELIISHDRYLLNTVPDIIIYLSSDGVQVFEGKFDELVSKTNIFNTDNKVKEKKQKTVTNYTTKADRAKMAQKRNEIYKIENEIKACEGKIAEIEVFIANNSSDFEKLEKACNELEEQKCLLDNLTEKWLELSEDE